jgi:hypothetical protein
MVERLVQKESFKMIREQVFIVPTKQVFPQKCQELIPDPSDKLNSIPLFITLSLNHMQYIFIIFSNLFVRRFM